MEEPGRLQSMGSQRVGHDWGANNFTLLSGCLHRPDLASGFTGSLLPSQDTILLQCPLVIKQWLNIAWASQVALAVKNPPASAGDLRDLDSIPRSGRCPGGENGNPLQCSCLENPKDVGADIGRLQSLGSQRAGHDWAAAVWCGRCLSQPRCNHESISSAFWVRRPRTVGLAGLAMLGTVSLGTRRQIPERESKGIWSLRGSEKINYSFIYLINLFLNSFKIYSLSSNSISRKILDVSNTSFNKSARFTGTYSGRRHKI